MNIFLENFCQKLGYHLDGAIQKGNRSEIIILNYMVIFEIRVMKEELML